MNITSYDRTFKRNTVIVTLNAKSVRKIDRSAIIAPDDRTPIADAPAAPEM